MRNSCTEYTLLAEVLNDAYNFASQSTANYSQYTSDELEAYCFEDKDYILTRLEKEGIGVLTKTLPLLGKCLDKALTLQEPFDASPIGFKSIGTDENPSVVPCFMQVIFARVLDSKGGILPDADWMSVALIRQVCYLFYKYKLPYSHEQEQRVVSEFERTEDELKEQRILGTYRPNDTPNYSALRRRRINARKSAETYLPTKDEVIRGAQDLLEKLFLRFDPLDITPSHGPGAVSTREQLWAKYEWTNTGADIHEVYPLDEYFFVSLTHVVDCIDMIKRIDSKSHPAKVILVPKDSRGPRLISCEPVDKQWVQQGLGRAIVRHVELHPLTERSVRFTDQSSNAYVALKASKDMAYATLDLKEASDRVHTDLVRLLFPRRLVEALIACRSSCTKLPDGRIIQLEKFAPMGSALCFPIMALTIWSILYAAAPDRHTRERVLVYGDDVIVKTQYASCAIEQLESFGLKVNRDKSCIKGFFRESCGTDAFKGDDVTPIRIRSVWSSRRSASVYSSYIAYANEFYVRGFRRTYNYIVGLLEEIYQQVPDKSMGLPVPSLHWIPESMRPNVSRPARKVDKFGVKTDYQRLEYKVWDVETRKIRKEINGWSMLLRFFTEAQRKPAEEPSWDPTWIELGGPGLLQGEDPFQVRMYTPRRRSMLRRRWRGA